MIVLAKEPHNLKGSLNTGKNNIIISQIKVQTRIRFSKVVLLIRWEIIEDSNFSKLLRAIMLM